MAPSAQADTLAPTGTLTVLVTLGLAGATAGCLVSIRWDTAGPKQAWEST